MPVPGSCACVLLPPQAQPIRCCIRCSHHTACACPLPCQQVVASTAAATVSNAAAAAAAPKREPKRPDPDPRAILQRLQRVAEQAPPLSAADSSSAVKLGKELFKALSAKKERELPPPALVEAALAALAAAEAAVRAPGHKGHLLTERAKLLQLVGAAGEAARLAEEAALLLGDSLRAWEATPEAAAPNPAGATPSDARKAAAAALHSLLDVTGVLRQLGAEERANALLAGAVRTAPKLPSSPSYLRAVGQLSQLEGEGSAGAQQGSRGGDGVGRMRQRAGGTSKAALPSCCRPVPLPLSSHALPLSSHTLPSLTRRRPAGRRAQLHRGAGEAAGGGAGVVRLDGARAGRRQAAQRPATFILRGAPRPTRSQVRRRARLLVSLLPCDLRAPTRSLGRRDAP